MRAFHLLASCASVLAALVAASAAAADDGPSLALDERQTTPHLVPADVTVPGLQFLYTMNCSLGSHAVPVGAGPQGTRTVIPIVGGSFKGPKMSGSVLNLGADWLLKDNRNVSHYNTRYQLHTEDGADIFIQTFGSSQPNGLGYLHGLFETGAETYWWLNNAVAVGTIDGGGDGGGVGGAWIRIDMFYLTMPANVTRAS